MCARANRASVPESATALLGSLVAILGALAALGIALATAPYRLLTRRPGKHGMPAGTDGIDIQVHLSRADRVHSIERACRAALQRSARTWAPFPLPLDRVEVLSSAPPLGKVDIYERWVSSPVEIGDKAGSLIVVSIGTAVDARELTPDEIAGALAGQIERLVIDRYEREHRKEPTGATRDAAQPVQRPIAFASAPRHEVALPETSPRPSNVTDLSDVRALLADIKKSQPLVPAGPSANGVHSELDPA